MPKAIVAESKQLLLDPKQQLAVLSCYCLLRRQLPRHQRSRHQLEGWSLLLSQPHVALAQQKAAK